MNLSTPFFTGLTTALLRGIIEGAIGLDQTVATSIYELTRDDKPVSDDEFYSFSYSYKKAIGEYAKQWVGKFEEAIQAIKPEAFSQGTAAEVVNRLGKFAPAIGAT